AGSDAAYVGSRSETMRTALHVPPFSRVSSAHASGVPATPVEWIRQGCQVRLRRTNPLSPSFRACRYKDGARTLLTADIEQGLVRPHVFVTGGDQETRTRREQQVSRHLGKPFHKMARVQRHEEVGCAGQLARPYVPA